MIHASTSVIMKNASTSVTSEITTDKYVNENLYKMSILQKIK